MIRPLATILITAGLLTAQTAVVAKERAKSNEDLEMEMAAEMDKRLLDPRSEDAREMERQRSAGKPASRR